MMNTTISGSYGADNRQSALLQLLADSDRGAIRIIEDILDLLIAKNLVLFTELVPEAQERIKARAELRKSIASDPILVDDVL